MEEIVVRAATADDVPAIDEIACLSWEWAYPDFVPEEILELGAKRGRRIPWLEKAVTDDLVFLVAVLEDFGVAGFVRAGVPPALEGYDSEIAAFYCHPLAARKGAGADLFHEFRRIHSGASLCIHTLVDNKIGRGFYEKMGGVKVADAEWRGMASLWYGWNAEPHSLP